MAHQFTVNAAIQGVSLDDFKRLAENISLHEAVCRRIPGENLEILESHQQNYSIYSNVQADPAEHIVLDAVQFAKKEKADRKSVV